MVFHYSYRDNFVDINYLYLETLILMLVIWYGLIWLIYVRWDHILILSLEIEKQAIKKEKDELSKNRLDEIERELVSTNYHCERTK